MATAIHPLAPRPTPRAALDALRDVPGFDDLSRPAAYMSHHSRSFRFAAAFLRGAERDRITRMYAWCRFTDDLGDRPTGGDREAEPQLDAWLACSRAAYEGRGCGIPLVDAVMQETADAGIPFSYAAELVEGVRGDLRFVPYEDIPALRTYTWRVAGVVGRWLAELHGVRDPWMLDRAAALGHAMQLTNILRDVGEDWGQGRLYLPLGMLRQRAIEPADIGAMCLGERPIDASYRAIIEDLLRHAERDYAHAREAIPFLPGGFRRATAVAAAVYEGIHDAIRRNGYDNLRRRAVTSTMRKLVLAAEALCARQENNSATSSAPIPASIPWSSERIASASSRLER
jgi:phytoene synthase